MIRLAYVERVLKRPTAVAETMERLAAIEPRFAVDEIQYPPSFRKEFEEARRRAASRPKTRLTITDRVRSREDNPSAKIGSFLEMSLNGKPMTAAQVIEGVNAVTREQVVRVASLVRPDTIFYLTRP